MNKEIKKLKLQWVHGPQTVVMCFRLPPHSIFIKLQWVHGPQTVVMNRLQMNLFLTNRLQWVHGPQTVVMKDGKGNSAKQANSFNGSTVLRPWLCDAPLERVKALQTLQWVHGPQTVVMFIGESSPWEASIASMGPRSSDRGYATERVLAHRQL